MSLPNDGIVVRIGWKMKFAYAVMDGNQASDQDRWPASCHRTKAAAIRQAIRNNRESIAHYYVVSWDAPRWSQERASPGHDCGSDGWMPTS